MSEDARSVDPGPNTNGDDIPNALLTALTTDHFVLQSAASTTVSEAVGRSALFTSTLSSSLVALGFATSRPSILTPLLAIVVPTTFVLGVFTVVRLVDTGVANVAYLEQIAQIRVRYASMSTEAPSFFPQRASRRDQALESLGTHASVLTGFSTTASMIAVVNSIIGGVGVALLVHLATGNRLWPCVVAGAAVFFVFVLLFLRYQDTRYRAVAK